MPVTRLYRSSSVRLLCHLTSSSLIPHSYCRYLLLTTSDERPKWTRREVARRRTVTTIWSRVPSSRIHSLTGKGWDVGRGVGGKGGWCEWCPPGLSSFPSSGGWDTTHLLVFFYYKNHQISFLFLMCSSVLPRSYHSWNPKFTSHIFLITSKPFNHQQWSQDGGDRRWPLEVIDEAGRSLTSRSRFLSLVPFRPEERRNGWEEREALASLTPPCGANDMRPEWAKRERNVSEPFRRLSPLSARFLSSRSFHSLPEDVRAEERGEGQTTVGNEWEDERRTRRSDKVTNIIFLSHTKVTYLR